jgi:hypothetical protein
MTDDEPKLETAEDCLRWFIMEVYEAYGKQGIHFKSLRDAETVLRLHGYIPDRCPIVFGQDAENKGETPMADERWKECKHHHHGCACREHTWEDRVAGLEAEVTRLSNLADHLEEESGQRDCAALEAEVERLGRICQSFIADPFGRAQASEAEVARLKAELERLRLTFLECAHCKGAMLISTQPPCCDNCTLDEEDVEEWEEAVLWRNHEGGTTK